MENKYTELHEKLSKLHWLLHRHYMMNHAEHGPFSDASRGQGRVLAALKMQPDISTKDLSYLLGIRVPSLNELLSKLEKGEYIVRKPSDADRRVMLTQLTEKGKAIQPADTDYSNIFDCLNEDEIKKFAEYLDRVIGSLEAQVGNMPDEEAMHNWMRGARSRMGDERFENFMAMRQGGFGRGCEASGRGEAHDHIHGAGHQVGGMPDEEAMHNWMRAARSRMGDERFENFMSMRQGGFGRGCEASGRGEAHNHMHGAGRFDPDYDGPMPEGREMPAGWERKGKQDTSDDVTDHESDSK